MNAHIIYAGTRSKFHKKFLPVAVVLLIIAAIVYPIERLRHDDHTVTLGTYSIVVLIIIGIFGLALYLQKEVVEIILHPHQKKITLSYMNMTRERTYSIPFNMLVLEYKMKGGKYGRNGRIRISDGRQYFDITMMGNNLTSEKLDAVYNELKKAAAQVKA